MLVPFLVGGGLVWSLLWLTGRARRAASDLESRIVAADLSVASMANALANSDELYDRLADKLGDKDGTLTVVFDLDHGAIQAWEVPASGPVRYLVGGVLLADGTPLAAALTAADVAGLQVHELAALVERELGERTDAPGDLDQILGASPSAAASLDAVLGGGA